MYKNRPPECVDNVCTHNHRDRANIAMIERRYYEVMEYLEMRPVICGNYTLDWRIGATFGVPFCCFYVLFGFLEELASPPHPQAHLFDKGDGQSLLCPSVEFSVPQTHHETG
jgi:hypothetical protein